MTITVYVDQNLLSTLINISNGKMDGSEYKDDPIRQVSLEKTKEAFFELQIPITVLSQFFYKDNYALINLTRVPKEK